jgi:hypothetical protein
MIFTVLSFYYRYMFDNGYDDCHPGIQFQRVLLDNRLEFLCDTWFILSSTYQNEDISEGSNQL